MDGHLEIREADALAGSCNFCSRMAARVVSVMGRHSGPNMLVRFCQKCLDELVAYSNTPVPVSPIFQRISSKRVAQLKAAAEEIHEHFLALKEEEASMARKELKGYLVKVRLNVMVFTNDEKGAARIALTKFKEQMTYNGWDNHPLATSAIPGTFYEDGEDTFVDSVEELVISSEWQGINGVWAKREEEEQGGSREE